MEQVMKALRIHGEVTGVRGVRIVNGPSAARHRTRRATLSAAPAMRGTLRKGQTGERGRAFGHLVGRLCRPKRRRPAQPAL